MVLKNVETVNTWIDQLSELVGISPEPLNSEGVSAIAFENGIEVNIGVADANPAVHLFANVLDAPADGLEMYQAMHRVLAYNSTLMGLYPCGIGLSPDEDFFVMHQRAELEGMTLEDFSMMLSLFSSFCFNAGQALSELV